ncbi:hypothetical protein [Paraburkholderia caballeronis]|uniref:hypothetical protein n=1 Tax=Paraburkholderia caballeronis TaxID=416943 RepID=UPI0010650F57|nr:hypothetical protein [Paraburkholderia caballeronis]TDV01704.1 hypothetical protein C7408_1488 [Paraburkholderia caballeronis]TDV06304.1 hypothetical protein C7406_1448 [Paraburkholderia caballeronis]TDV16093.1 hypothetical protein C7404_1488 [Paraburkholderia caballeronis]TDV23227.1 hypothetical protein C7405_1348 [Paraburkholderia caballeronis]
MKRLLCVLALAAQLAACSQPTPDSLVGAWAGQDDGRPYPFLKIEKRHGHYVLYTNVDGRWRRESDYVEIASRADLERLVHHPVTCDVTGLKTSVVIVFDVRPGCPDAGFSTRSGYFASTWFGAVELVRLAPA